MINIGKTKLTKDLELAIWNTTHKMGVYGCFEVTIGYNGKERVDYMTYDTKDIFRCYEIKISEQDFNSSAVLSFVGNYNYFVLTPELYNIVWDKIPSEIGVYVLIPFGSSLICECVKKAKKVDLKIDKHILKNSMIRSLSREQSKVINNENPLLLEIEKNKVKLLEGANKKIIDNYNDLLLFIYNTYGFDWQTDFDNFTYSTSKKQREKERKTIEMKQFKEAQRLRNFLPKEMDVRDEIYAMKPRFM